MLVFDFDSGGQFKLIRTEHFFVSGQTTQVNAPALLWQATVIVVTI
jgi:hypothetical protein